MNLAQEDVQSISKQGVMRVKEIPLTQDKVALVDDEDFEWLNRWKWQFDGGYARRTMYHGRDESGKRIREIVWMHRLITDCPEGMVVDHIDGDVLNNQKHNLRICTRHENSMNRKARYSTRYKGLTINQVGNFMVRMIVENKPIFLGTFKSEVAAANCYNFFAVRFFGEFARLNDAPHMAISEWMEYRNSWRKGLWYDNEEWFNSLRYN